VATPQGMTMNEYTWVIAGVLVIAAALVGAVAKLVRAQAARIDRGTPAQQDPHLAQTLEDMQRRLGELEERVDFAERLLAKQRDSERLASPRG
jgi:hypothetical protein